MVKPSDPEAIPRRDGWLERRGTWGEVTVGSFLAGENRTDVWEVVDSAHPEQVEFGYTLWHRVANQKTGEVHAIPPKQKRHPVTFLMKSDEERPPDRTPPLDSDRIALLVEELGATLIASRDNATGEITCPDYNAGLHATSDWHYGKEYLHHLQICHGMDVSGLEAMPAAERLVETIKAHGQAHDADHPQIGKGGFPHRHIPEDLSIT